MKEFHTRKKFRQKSKQFFLIHPEFGLFQRREKISEVKICHLETTNKLQGEISDQTKKSFYFTIRSYDKKILLIHIFSNIVFPLIYKFSPVNKFFLATIKQYY